MGDIYIIRNTINDKVYIGQTSDMEQRWIRHISDANNKQRTLIAKAMASFGVSNFYYEFLERGIATEDLDSREIYWIKLIGSREPNGYNVTVGGVGTGGGIESVCSRFKTEEEFMEVVDDIRSTDMTFDDIAKKYGVSGSTISTINTGAYYRRDDFKYPLRETRISDDTLKKIFYSLKYERDKSMRSIAIEYGIDVSVLSEINNGKAHHVDWQTYPIRIGKPGGLTKEEVDEIIKMLRSSDIPQKDIARKYNVSVNCITAINKGRSFPSSNYSYPLRDNYQGKILSKRTFSPNELREIEDLIMYSDKSLRQIANEYECPICTIQNINRGSTKQYRNTKLKYPLRDNKTKPVSTTCA